MKETHYDFLCKYQEEQIFIVFQRLNRMKDSSLWKILVWKILDRIPLYPLVLNSEGWAIFLKVHLWIDFINMHLMCC